MASNSVRFVHLHSFTQISFAPSIFNQALIYGHINTIWHTHYTHSDRARHIIVVHFAHNTKTHWIKVSANHCFSINWTLRLRKKRPQWFALGYCWSSWRCRQSVHSHAVRQCQRMSTGGSYGSFFFLSIFAVEHFEHISTTTLALLRTIDAWKMENIPHSCRPWQFLFITIIQWEAKRVKKPSCSIWTETNLFVQ